MMDRRVERGALALCVSVSFRPERRASNEAFEYDLVVQKKAATEPLSKSLKWTVEWEGGAVRDVCHLSQ